MSDEAVRFERWGVFTDWHEPYREWRVLKDLPDLDARAGDEILERDPSTRWETQNGERGWEELPWNGCRFQVRQKGGKKVRRDVEDWQAVGIFGGQLPPWPVEGRAASAILRALRLVFNEGSPSAMVAVTDMTAKMMKGLAEDLRDRAGEEEDERLSDEDQAALALVGDVSGCQSVARLRIPVPDLDLGPGDVLVYSYGKFPRMHGQVRYLSLEDYQVLADAALGNREALTHLAGAGVLSVRYFLGHRQKWGQRLKVWRSRLAVVRPIQPSAATRIEASSDAAALFELIHGAGGKMPREP